MRYVYIMLLYISLMLNSHFALATNIPEATETPIVATTTPIKSTETPIVATATPIKSIETPIVATATPIRATETPVAATATPIKSTETPIVATATPIRATETPVVVTVIPTEPKQNINATTPLSSYERKTLWATWTYNFLTFFLLCFVVYESIIKPKMPDIECDIVKFRSGGVSQGGFTFPHQDLLIRNHGNELKNIQIASEPDELNWNCYDEDTKKEREDAKTSELFQEKIPRLAPNQTLQFYWCNALENKEVFQKPFIIHVEFDNPLPIPFRFKKRLKKSFYFDYSVYKGIISGIARRYDIHDVAKEISKMRESVEKFNRKLDRIIHEHESRIQNQEDKENESPDNIT